MPTFKPGKRATRLDELRESDDNPRTIEPDRWEALGVALRKDPRMLDARPSVADLRGEIVCGHMRHRRLVHDGVKTAPVFFEDFSGPGGDGRRREWKVRDNVPYGDWEPEGLSELVSLHRETEDDLQMLGLRDAELAELLDQADVSRFELDDQDQDQPRLDQRRIRVVTCPSCGEEFEAQGSGHAPVADNGTASC